MGSGMTETTIMAVDDDPDALDIVRTYLEAKGYRVITATDGREALAKP
jgi:CheY-like chemotaxis protein